MNAQTIPSANAARGRVTRRGMSPAGQAVHITSPVDIDAGLRTWGARQRQAGARPGGDRPVIVELEGAPCMRRLRVTEDAGSYGVMVEFDAAPALRDGHGSAVLNRSRRGWIALAFGQTIDAAASCGEFSEDLLHLLLCKQRSLCPTGAPRSMRAAAPAATARRPQHPGSTGETS